MSRISHNTARWNLNHKSTWHSTGHWSNVTGECVTLSQRRIALDGTIECHSRDGKFRQVAFLFEQMFLPMQGVCRCSAEMIVFHACCILVAPTTALMAIRDAQPRIQRWGVNWVPTINLTNIHNPLPNVQEEEQRVRETGKQRRVLILRWTIQQKRICQPTETPTHSWVVKAVSKMVFWSRTIYLSYSNMEDMLQKALTVFLSFFGCSCCSTHFEIKGSNFRQTMSRFILGVGTLVAPTQQRSIAVTLLFTTPSSWQKTHFATNMHTRWIPATDSGKNLRPWLKHPEFIQW